MPNGKHLLMCLVEKRSLSGANKIYRLLVMQRAACYQKECKNWVSSLCIFNSSHTVETTCPFRNLQYLVYNGLFCRHLIVNVICQHSTNNSSSSSPKIPCWFTPVALTSLIVYLFTPSKYLALVIKVDCQSPIT